MSSGGVGLSWTPANATSITAYRVYYRDVTASGTFVLVSTLAGSATTYTHGLAGPPTFGFIQGHVYEYKVEMDSA